MNTELAVRPQRPVEIGLPEAMRRFASKLATHANIKTLESVWYRLCDELHPQRSFHPYMPENQAEVFVRAFGMPILRVHLDKMRSELEIIADDEVSIEEYAMFKST